MDEMKEEDRTAPISEQEVLDSINASTDSKMALLDKLMDELNRKRDAYSGIVSSIRYVIDSKCQELISELQLRIVKLITAFPMRYGGKMFLTKVQARVVSERPLFVEEIYENILETTSEWSKNFPSENHILGLQIISVKSIKNAEHQRGGRPSKIDQEEFDDLCFKAIQSCDSSIKIDTFSFIFESRSTTKLLTVKEFYLFKVLFNASLDLQEPALRQTFLAVTNRVLKRLKKSHEFVIRDKRLYAPENKLEITKRYMEFLTWLIDYCFDNTYCNAYFGSFIITVSTLKLVIQHITYDDKDLNIAPLLKMRRCYDSLISCLSDSFEDNKSLALETLLLLPQNEHVFSYETIATYEKIAYELANSVNPAHSLTCQYVFKLVIGLKTKQQINTISRNQIILSHLSKLIDSIEKSLELRREGADLVKTLKDQPNYPKLSCIRVLLNEVDCIKLEDNYPEWCDLVKRVANCSIDLCEDISTIVCNPNPESIGHLPMDLKPINTSETSIDHNIEIENSNIVTSQMLLISGWKTIKESSLIFGTLCSKFWWPEVPTKPEKCPSRNVKPFLTQQLIHKILHFFNYYMKRLRHRGAFEQAYGGFNQVTNRLKYDKNMSECVLKSLDETLEDFKREDLEEDKAELLRASITRRSGGLPFSIQARLNLEEDPEAIKSIMNGLHDVIKSPDSDSYKKIHCMNILGALIRQHSQGEKVMPFVGMSFSIAIDAFKSDSYSIRNCANMLLKSTIDRTFGVNRLRIDIHRKNQLSFERFFSDSLDLHEQMIRILKDSYTDSTSFAAIHAVFIILFRLCPSLNPSGTFDQKKIILPFIEATKTILFQCTNPHLRVVSAQLLVRLENFYYQDIETAETHKYISGNYSVICKDPTSLHGLAMFYKSLIDYYGPGVNDSVICEINKLTNIREIGKGENRYNRIVELAFLELVESYAINLPERESFTAPLRKMSELSISFLHYKIGEKIYFISFYLNLMYKHREHHPQFKIPDIYYWKYHLSNNLTAGILKLFRQIMSKSECFVDYILERFDLDLNAALLTPYDKLKQNIDNDRNYDRMAKFCDQPQLAISIQQATSMEIFKLYTYSEFRVDCSSKKFSSKTSNTILGVELLAFALKNWDIFRLDDFLIWEPKKRDVAQKLDYATRIITDLPECDIKCLILLCAGKHVRYIVNNVNYKYSEYNLSESILQFSQILDHLADGDSSITIRESCVEVLKMVLIPALEREDCPLSRSSLINIFSTLIKLCQDEDSSIRHSSDVIISSLRNFKSPDQNRAEHEEIRAGSRLDCLIRILTTKVFNPYSFHDKESCFSLLMKIVFNHSKNYSNNLSDQKERLFDKTKLNTFADFVSIIENTFNGLEKFFKQNRDTETNPYNLIDITHLKFSDEVIEEFKLVDSPKPSNKGDYSWRLAKITKDLANLRSDTQSHPIDNRELMKTFILNIMESLSYFENGYSNVLLDTEYIYHELSLFKRISFLMFLAKFTDHKLDIELWLSKIKEKLDEIVSKLCCTTLLNKCLGLFA